MAKRSQNHWPSNQWPNILFNRWADLTAQANQAEAITGDTVLPLNEVRRAVINGWLEAMLPAGNA